MSRSLLVCLHCREPLAYVKPNGVMQPLAGVDKDCERPGVWWFTCPGCGERRRVVLTRDEAA